MSQLDAPRLVAAYAREDCGCPIEEWIYCNIELHVHFERDGTADVFADAGDWQSDFSVPAATYDAGREAVFAWVRSLPTEEQLASALAGEAA